MKISKWTKSNTTSNYMIVAVVFVLLVNMSLGLLLMRQAGDSIKTMMQTRMLDISNTAAAMLDGDDIETVTPADEGTPQYNEIMRILRYFQDNIELNYIYCIRDMGDGTFALGLDPDKEDPGEFGSPIVYTDALYKASKGIASADETKYEDSWGSFYSAYSPVFNSQGKIAGVIAVDFNSEWYEKQLVMLTRTSIVVALLSLVAGGSIAMAIITRHRRRLGEVHGQLSDLADNLMNEMGKAPASASSARYDGGDAASRGRGDDDIEALGKRIELIQTELRSQVARVHEQAYVDGLTGTKNRAAYLESMMEIEMMISDGGAAFSIAVFDLNGLKTINDNFGHESGDLAVCEAADLLKGVFGKERMYRTGGDEFVAILDTSDANEMLDLFARVDRETELINMVTRPYKMPLSISKGYAIHEDGDLYRDTFNRADLMMYRDKESFYSDNRNRRRKQPDEPAEEEA